MNNDVVNAQLGASKEFIREGDYRLVPLVFVRRSKVDQIGRVRADGVNPVFGGFRAKPANFRLGEPGLSPRVGILGEDLEHIAAITGCGLNSLVKAPGYGKMGSQE
jgi:hypothetical protein